MLQGPSSPVIEIKYGRGTDSCIRNGSTCSFLEYHDNVLMFRRKRFLRTSYKIIHNATYYNQYASNIVNAMSDAFDNDVIASHCQICFGGGSAALVSPENIGLTLVMDCRISYMRGSEKDPHGGVLVSAGHFRLTRQFLEEHGLLDNQFHSYCIRIKHGRASILLDWSKEVKVENPTPYLGSTFYDRYDSGTDTEVYRNNNGMLPGRILLGAHCADNSQKGPHRLSMYARTDCELTNMHVWNYCVHSTDQVYYRSMVSFPNKVILPLAVLIKGWIDRPALYLPHPMLVYIAEYLWDDPFSKCPPYVLVDKLVNLFTSECAGSFKKVKSK